MRVAYDYDWFNVYNASHPVDRFPDVPLGPSEDCDFVDAEVCDDECLAAGDEFFFENDLSDPDPRVC